MSKRFFDLLELDLAGLTRDGAHLEADAHSRLVLAVRRSLTIMMLAVVLAVSFVSEFPGTANGLPITAAMAAAHPVPVPHATST